MRFPQTQCFLWGSADGGFAKGLASMIYETLIRRPRAKRLSRQANGGFCRRVPSPRVLTKEKVKNTCDKEIPGTVPTLNRSTWSEAMAPSGARPGRVFDDEGGKYGKANRPRGCMRGQSPLY